MYSSFLEAQGSGYTDLVEEATVQRMMMIRKLLLRRVLVIFPSQNSIMIQ
jgi:hypothetical protein